MSLSHAENSASSCVAKLVFPCQLNFQLSNQKLSSSVVLFLTNCFPNFTVSSVISSSINRVAFSADLQKNLASTALQVLETNFLFLFPTWADRLSFLCQLVLFEKGSTNQELIDGLCERIFSRSVSNQLFSQSFSTLFDAIPSFSEPTQLRLLSCISCARIGDFPTQASWKNLCNGIKVFILQVCFDIDMPLLFVCLCAIV